MKKVLLFVAIAIFGLTSCSSDDNNTDSRDKYVGTWQSKTSGSLTIYHNGEPTGTIPINETGTTEVSKSGENNLSIGGQIFTLNGNSLTTNPKNTTITQDGVNMVGTETFSGQVSSEIITINSDYVGTWSHSNGNTGNFSGTVVTTLTK